MATGAMRPFVGGLQAARQTLLEARTRDELVETLLGFSSSRFEAAAVFFVSNGTLQGHDAVGGFSRAANRAAMQKISLRPPSGSMFRTAIDVGGHLLGPVPANDFDKVLLSDLGRDTPKGALLVPVSLRGRVVMIFYADNGAEDLPPESVVDALTICAALPAIFESLIRKRKEGGADGRGEDERALMSEVADAFADAPLDALSLERPLPDPALDGGELGSSDMQDAPGEDEHEEKTREARIESKSGRLDSPEVIADRLAMGGEAEPALLVALAEHGDEGANALALRFPGPTKERVKSFFSMDRDPMSHGPVVAAMAFLGPSATDTLLELLSSKDADARLYVAFLFSIGPDSRALPSLIEMISDPDPRVATGARWAIGAHRGMPGYREALEELRGELGRRDDPLRLCDVLRTAAFLADEKAVSRIVDLLDHGDREVVSEAECALQRITKQTHGTSKRRWQKWHDANRGTSRIAWLVEGLSSRSLEVRESSLIELEDLVGESFGFVPDGSRSERARAVERWHDWLSARGEG